MCGDSLCQLYVQLVLLVGYCSIFIIVPQPPIVSVAENDKITRLENELVEAKKKLDMANQQLSDKDHEIQTQKERAERLGMQQNHLYFAIMSLPPPESVFDTELACAVCYEMFDEVEHCPLIYKCGHTVCKSYTDWLDVKSVRYRLEKTSNASSCGGNWRFGSCPFCKNAEIIDQPYRKNWFLMSILGIPCFIFLCVVTFLHIRLTKESKRLL